MIRIFRVALLAQCLVGMTHFASSQVDKPKQKDNISVTEKRLFDRLKQNSLNQAHSYDEEFKIADSILALDPGNQSALYLQAQICANKQEYKKAIIILSTAISKHADSERWYLFRGALYEIVGNQLSANSDYHKVSELLSTKMKSLKDGTEQQLFYIGSMSTLQLIQDMPKNEVLVKFERAVMKNKEKYDPRKLKHVRSLIFYFSKESYLSKFRRGLLAVRG